jgi:hypothetical protein
MVRRSRSDTHGIVLVMDATVCELCGRILARLDAYRRKACGLDARSTAEYACRHRPKWECMEVNDGDGLLHRGDEITRNAATLSTIV